MDVSMTLLRENDLQMVMDWRTRPYVTKYMNTDPVLTIEKQKEWYDRLKDRRDQKHWIINFEGSPIGSIYIFDIDSTNSRCSWGYYVAEKEYRSLKLAMYLEWNLYDYVFKTMKLNKLYNEVFVENQQVVKLHIMCGGKEEGIMRQHIFKNGIYYDISVISILAEEWLEKKKTIKYETFRFE